MPLGVEQREKDLERYRRERQERIGGLERHTCIMHAFMMNASGEIKRWGQQEIGDQEFLFLCFKKSSPYLFISCDSLRTHRTSRMTSPSRIS